MPLTVYEKHNVRGGMNAIVTGFVDHQIGAVRAPRNLQHIACLGFAHDGGQIVARSHMEGGRLAGPGGHRQGQH